MKKELQFQISPMFLTNTIMGLIKSLYKELAKNDLGKTLLIGRYDEHLPDETWTVSELDDETEVHFKETEHAIHILLVTIKQSKK